MAEDTIRIVSPLDGAATAGRHGRRSGDAGVTLSEVREPGLAAISALKGRRAALGEAARAAFGVELPDLPRRAEGHTISFVWAGPERWLAHAPEAPPQGMEAHLRQAFGGLAAIVDQSHACTLFNIAGPRVREALAKGVPIDLDARAFKPGFAAITRVAHIGVHLWQIDEAPTYAIAVPRGLALAFWRWLEASAAEYGLELIAPPSVSSQR